MSGARWRVGCAAMVVAVVLSWPAGASARSSVSTRCRAAIVKSTGLYIGAQTKALTKCWDAVVAGKQVGPCPDVKARNGIDKARAKLDFAIAKVCGGADKVCGAATAPDVALGVIGWNIGSCSNVGGGACSNPIADCRDIITCVACVSDAAVAQGFDLYYHAGVMPGADKELRKCVREVGRASASVLAKLSQSLAKCWLGVNKSESGGSFSCPDAHASSVSAKARSSQAASICKACGRKNGCGGGDDIAPATIGFPLQCPAIGSCGGSIQTLQDVASCSACVTGVVADGAARNSIPAFTSPPPQCVTLPMSPTN